MFKIKCPACQTEGSMFLVDSGYVGPYRCWKCHALYTVEIKGDQLASYKPLSEEELKKQQDMKKLQEKYKKDTD
jgi:hypothetical protein